MTRKVEVGGHDVYVHVGFFEDDTPGEVFIHVGKEGSTLAGMIDTLAITISLALQHGVPWEALAEHYYHRLFEPRDERFKSISDAVGRTVTDLIRERRDITGVDESDLSAVSPG